MKTLKIFSIILGIILFLGFFIHIGINEVLTKLINANLFLVLLALFILMVDDFYEVIKLNYIIASLEKKVSLFYLYKSYIFSRVLKTIFPINASEFILVFFLKSKKIKASHSTAIIFFELIISFIIISALAIIGLLVLDKYRTAIILLLITFGIVILAFLVSIKMDKIVFLKKIIKSKRKFEFIKLTTQKIKFIFSKKQKIVVTNLFLSFFNWIITGTVLYLSIIAFGINVNWFQIVLVNAMISIITLIPLTPGAIGIKEASGSVLLNTFLSVPLIESANAMLLLRLLGYLSSMIYYVATKDLLEKNKTILRSKNNSEIKSNKVQ